MTLYEELLKSRNEQRYLKTPISIKIVKLLGTLIGDLQNEAKIVDGEKVVDDSAVLKKIKKYVKTAKANLELQPDNEQFNFEIYILEQFLPVQMTEEEITQMADYFIDNFEFGEVSIGYVMKTFKEQYDGLYDPAFLNRYVTERLK